MLRCFNGSCCRGKKKSIAATSHQFSSSSRWRLIYLNQPPPLYCNWVSQLAWPCKPFHYSCAAKYFAMVSHIWSFLPVSVIFFFNLESEPFPKDFCTLQQWSHSWMHLFLSNVFTQCLHVRKGLWMCRRLGNIERWVLKARFCFDSPCSTSQPCSEALSHHFFFSLAKLFQSNVKSLIGVHSCYTANQKCWKVCSFVFAVWDTRWLCDLCLHIAAFSKTGRVL